MTRNLEAIVTVRGRKMPVHKLTSFRFWFPCQEWRNICRRTVFQGRFDLDFSMIRRGKGKGPIAHEVNLTPSFVDARARYDNRILVSRFVTSLPKRNIIPLNPRGTLSPWERVGEMIFVLSNFRQNQIVV
jgi:hypothetical protein